MRTAVISDLHLGTRSRVDLLRSPQARARLTAALRSYDQLVLLGDTFELRDRPLRTVLDDATPFLAEVGAALRGGRVVLVPGNHDHRLVIEALGPGYGRGNGLGLQEEIAPGPRGTLAAIRDRLATDLVLAYPGVRIGPGVWATHGHYLDVHSSELTVESLASALVAGARRSRARHPPCPAEYEALLRPGYDLMFAIAQRPRLQRHADAAKRLVRGLETSVGSRPPQGVRAPPAPRPGRRARLGGDRVGLAPGELRRPGVLPIGRVLERLGVEADHVLFGHTHRTGPLPGDRREQWTTAGGTSLVNTGCWVDEPLAHEGAAAYRPGTMVEIAGSGPPRIHHLLDDGQRAPEG